MKHVIHKMNFINDIVMNRCPVILGFLAFVLLLTKIWYIDHVYHLTMYNLASCIKLINVVLSGSVDSTFGGSILLNSKF